MHDNPVGLRCRAGDLAQRVRDHRGRLFEQVTELAEYGRHTAGTVKLGQRNLARRPKVHERGRLATDLVELLEAKRTPASCAMAGRWRATFVEPDTATASAGRVANACRGYALVQRPPGRAEQA